MELHVLANRVRAEFNEMPDLRLTLTQATRLWGLERHVCATVVESLIQASFLRRTQDGSILRAQ